MHISLRHITADTVRQVTDLAVAPGQERFVANNAVSLAQALFAPEAWYRAIYLDEGPVGFVLLYDESLRLPPPDKPEVGIWRFMIDARYQGRAIDGRAGAAQPAPIPSTPALMNASDCSSAASRQRASPG